jgi:hemerythrin-like domain-containing protein
MGSIADYMTSHHKACDEMFARAEEAAAAADWVVVERDGGAFLREMARHFGIEEDLLFPAFEGATGMAGGPTMAMCMEHDQMRDLFAQMRSAIDAKDTERFLDVSETLLVLMQQHNMKEEHMIYPTLDQLLGEEAKDLIARAENVTA